MSLEEWQELGKGQGSIIADPLFIDPENSDFRLKPGSPAARIGFSRTATTDAVYYLDDLNLTTTTAGD